MSNIEIHALLKLQNELQEQFLRQISEYNLQACSKILGDYQPKLD